MKTNQDRQIWLNGRIIPLEDATINVMSPTAQFGANVFEGIRCYWNKTRAAHFAFKLEDHFDRLERSLKMFRLEAPLPREAWAEAIRRTIQANGYREDVAVRQTVFVDGCTGTWSSSDPAGMFIAPVPRSRKSVPLMEGIACCISSWRRIHDRSMSPKIKCGANYINSRMAQLEAVRNGYDSAIFLNDAGTVAEGPGAAFFMVRDGRLITPPLWSSILESITRAVLMDLAWTQLGIVVEERPIDRTELYVCDEAFFCGSAAELTPIVSIDGYLVGNGVAGPLTTSLHKVYLKAAEGSLPSGEPWGIFL
ncbi:MAG: branched-chain amino acid transaminase [Desulfovibrio desulfuricans]|nr:branched-chain amino acid transaminase [Desulfovibrio desulfuricans]